MPQPKSAIPEGDLYALFKQKEGELAFLDVQERYVKDEIKNLKRELIRAKEEVARIQSVPWSSASSTRWSTGRMASLLLLLGPCTM